MTHKSFALEDNDFDDRCFGLTRFDIGCSHFNGFANVRPVLAMTME